MNLKGRRAALAIVLCLALGLGLGGVTPAGAALAENWSKIWKKEIRPKADKRYYKKVDSDARYQAKGSYAPAGSSYTKGESDAKYAGAGTSYTKGESDGKYAGAGTSYTKGESDARYAPYPSLIRGTYDAVGYAAAANASISDNISFGYTLPAAPIAHYIPSGGLLPVGCSGTVAAPNASPGHLCVFESQNVNVGVRDIYNAQGLDGASTFGASAWIRSAAAGQVFVYGSWAVRPGGPVTSPGLRETPTQGDPEGQGPRAGE